MFENHLIHAHAIASVASDLENFLPGSIKPKKVSAALSTLQKIRNLCFRYDLLPMSWAPHIRNAERHVCSVARRGLAALRKHTLSGVAGAKHYPGLAQELKLPQPGTGKGFRNCHERGLSMEGRFNQNRCREYPTTTKRL